jgi:hypothetical protein
MFLKVFTPFFPFLPFSDLPPAIHTFRFDYSRNANPAFSR